MQSTRGPQSELAAEEEVSIIVRRSRVLQVGRKCQSMLAGVLLSPRFTERPLRASLQGLQLCHTLPGLSCPPQVALLNLVYFMNMSSGYCPISSTVLVKVRPRPSQTLQCVSCGLLEGSLRSSEPSEISSRQTGFPLAGLFLLSV